MERLNTIKELINQGNVEQAIQQLDEILQTDFPGKDEAYYLRGNAYRKQGNWQLSVCHRPEPRKPGTTCLSNGYGHPELLQQGYVQSINKERKLWQKSKEQS